MALLLWTPDFVDPYGYVNRLLDTQDAGGTNLARFDEPKYIREMRDAPACAAPIAARYTRSSTSNSKTRPARSVFRPQRGDAPLGIGCQLLRPALVLTTAA